jgi:HAD superfamily hydrolase (TIGR01490 family)
MAQVSASTPKGKRAAFFDMDKTLVAANTGVLYARWRFRRGESGLKDVARVLWWSAQYTAGLVDASAVSEYAASTLGGRDEAAFAEECRGWFREMVLPIVAAKARVEVERRRREGYLLAILTGSSPYAAGPLGIELGIEHWISSTLEVDAGTFTGKVEAPLCFGEGKVARARAFAAKHDIDLAASVFYSDSISDLPMLLAVGEPIVVNPDPRLRVAARRKGWPIERW